MMGPPLAKLSSSTLHMVDFVRLAVYFSQLWIYGLRITHRPCTRRSGILGLIKFLDIRVEISKLEELFNNFRSDRSQEVKLQKHAS